MPDFQSMLDSFNAPNTRHAMLVHFPIVLSIVGAVLALLAATLRSNVTLRALAIVGQVALLIATFAALNSGQAADGAIERVLTPEVYELIAEHESMADKVWLIALGTLLALALSAALKRAAGTAFAWIAVVVAAGGAAWVGATAHHGGNLVYGFGVGTPQPVACIDLPGVRSDGRDHAAEHAAATQAAATQREAEPDVTGGGDGEARLTFFRDQAYPILSEHCFNCHNPARAGRDKSGRLDQTSREAVLAGGRNGPAIIVGDPGASLLIHRMRGDDPDLRMMPPDGQLSEQQIAIIEQWIRDGAVWPPDL